MCRVGHARAIHGRFSRGHPWPRIALRNTHAPPPRVMSPSTVIGGVNARFARVRSHRQVKRRCQAPPVTYSMLSANEGATSDVERVTGDRCGGASHAGPEHRSPVTPRSKPRFLMHCSTRVSRNSTATRFATDAPDNNSMSAGKCAADGEFRAARPAGRMLRRSSRCSRPAAPPIRSQTKSSL